MEKNLFRMKKGHAPYKIINTDALYRNTSTPGDVEVVMIEQDGSLSDFYDFSKKTRKNINIC